MGFLCRLFGCNSNELPEVQKVLLVDSSGDEIPIMSVFSDIVSYMNTMNTVLAEISNNTNEIVEKMGDDNTLLLDLIEVVREGNLEIVSKLETINKVTVSTDNPFDGTLLSVMRDHYASVETHLEYITSITGRNS